MDDDDRTQLKVACGQCGSEDVHFVACPEHEWAIAFMCYGCLATYVIGEGACQDCGWRGE